MPRGTTAATVGIVVCLLGLALVAAGAIVMAQRDRGLGLGVVAGGFVLVVVGSRLSSPRRPKAGGDRPSGRA